MAAAIPFPVASGRYEVGPGMRRFGQAGAGMEAEQGHFWPDGELACTLAAKLAVLRRAPDQAHLRAPGLDAAAEASLRGALQGAWRALAAEHPAMVTAGAESLTLHHLGLRLTGWLGAAPGLEAAGDGWAELGALSPAVRDWLTGQEGTDLLGGALGLAVQEDLAIVRGPAGDETDRLEWLHVCLPSNWAPAEKIGGSFVAVHQPVVHSERLLTSQAQIVKAMIHGGPFVRYVWSIHRDAELCHNPRLHRSEPWRSGASPQELADQAWFRVERQTTLGFGRLNRALFTIRYWVEPLVQTASDPWRRERLAAALAGMDGAELAYKGLTDVRGALVTWLRSGE